MTSSSVSRQAARIGSAPFLFPGAVMVPDSGTPPSMTNFSSLIDPAEVVGGWAPVSLAGDGGRGGTPSGPGRAKTESSARVTAMQLEDSRAQAWDLLCEWTRSDSLRR